MVLCYKTPCEFASYPLVQFHLAIGEAKSSMQTQARLDFQ